MYNNQGTGIGETPAAHDMFYILKNIHWKEHDAKTLLQNLFRAFAFECAFYPEYNCIIRNIINIAEEANVMFLAQKSGDIETDPIPGRRSSCRTKIDSHGALYPKVFRLNFDTTHQRLVDRATIDVFHAHSIYKALVTRIALGCLKILLHFLHASR
jgi:hypothetical protein